MEVYSCQYVIVACLGESNIQQVGFVGFDSIAGGGLRALGLQLPGVLTTLGHGTFGSILLIIH